MALKYQVLSCCTIGFQLLQFTAALNLECALCDKFCGQSCVYARGDILLDKIALSAHYTYLIRCRFVCFLVCCIATS